MLYLILVRETSETKLQKGLIVLASGLFLIGLVCATLFTEVYGFYLLFTEPELYTADLAQNGLLSFTTFFILFNIACLSWQAGQGISGR